MFAQLNGVIHISITTEKVNYEKAMKGNLN